MDPAFRGNKPGDHLLFGINWDGCLEEMFSDLTGSFREIVTAVPAGKTWWIDCCYGNNIIVWVKQAQRFSEGQSETERFYPAEKFLERGEMGNDWEIKGILNFFHVSNIFDKFPVVLVPEVFEKNEDKKLMLGESLLRVLAGIRLEMSRLYNGCSRLDKPDIPARWLLIAYLSPYMTTHQKRRHCTLDLSVVGTTCSWLGFQQCKNFITVSLLEIGKNFRYIGESSRATNRILFPTIPDPRSLSFSLSNPDF